MKSTDMATEAVRAALARQAGYVEMMDVSERAGFADYFVVCSADTERQIKAVCDGINEVLTQEGVNLIHCEGDVASGWVVLDYCSVVVHVFAPVRRDYYNLPTLWLGGSPAVGAS